MGLPQDDFILLSYVNTKLRDEYSSLEDFCTAEGAETDQVAAKLNGIGYYYDEEENAFKRA